MNFAKTIAMGVIVALIVRQITKQNGSRTNPSTPIYGPETGVSYYA